MNSKLRYLAMLHCVKCEAEGFPCGCSNKLAKKQLEAEQKHQALENELNGYKTNLIKNSIRMCQTYMGDHAYNRGNLQVGRMAALLASAVCISDQQQECSSFAGL